MVFKCLKEVNLKIKPSKYEFFKKELKFLGYRVSSKKIYTNSFNIIKIQNKTFISIFNSINHDSYRKAANIITVTNNYRLNIAILVYKDLHFRSDIGFSKYLKHSPYSTRDYDVRLNTIKYKKSSSQLHILYKAISIFNELSR